MLPQVILHPSDKAKYEKLNHTGKKCEFLALRLCLREYFGENPPVFYYDNGKPYLEGPHHISFSHTNGFAGMIISRQGPVGIDLEVYRASIKRIAPKFLRKEEASALTPEWEVDQIIHFWGAKEVMVKITGDRRMNFKKHLRVSPFAHQNFQETSGMIRSGSVNKRIKLYFKTIRDLHISYGWEAASRPANAFTPQKLS